MGVEPTSNGDGVTPRNSGASEVVAAASQETPYANVCHNKSCLPMCYLLIIPMYSASAIGQFDP